MSNQGSTSVQGVVKGDQREQLGEPLVSISAYCLMPNHFHLLIREIRDGGISKFMQKLTTAYTMYFNIKNERTGALLEGGFKARHADTDEYLKYLISYIHLNPVKLIDPKWKEEGIADTQHAKTYLEQYPYSSYLDYLGKERVQGKILDRASLPEYFESVKDFESNLAEWLNYNPKTYRG